MKKSKIISALLVTFVLSGCAREYEANMNARKQIAWTQTTNQRLATADVMHVIEKVLAPFEEQAKIQQEKDGVVLFGNRTKIPAGDNYAMFLMAETMGKMIEWQGRAEIMRARAQAIQYLTPIIQSIYSQHMSDFGTPMTTNEVYAKLVGQIPFVATIGGMYALGREGIKQAGDSLSASEGSTINSGSNVADGGSASGVGNSISTTTETTTTETITPPVIEE